MKKRILLPLIIVLVLIAGIFGSSDEPVPDDPVSRSGISTEATDPVLPEDTSLQPTTPEAPEPDKDSSSVGEDEDPPEVVTPIVSEDPAEIPEDSTFEIHFIDVGQGDCSLILCDGKAMLIDGGESSESSKVYAYLKAHGIDHLDCMVATHAHSDHIGGLSGALNYASVGTAYCSVTEYDSKTFSSMVKYLNNQGLKIAVPSAGDTFSLGSATVQILGPQRTYDDPNDMSIVLKITYGETSFLFTGDAERTAEADILDAGYDLSSTVLKVGHHGSDSSTSYPFLREIMPEYAVIQAGKDNSYGHPTEDTLSRLRDADVKVYRNDLQGTVICTSDGESVTFSTEKNESVQTNPTVTPEANEPDDAGEYIGNKNSKKFHLPTCKNLPAEKNRVYLSSRQEAIDGGYDPCGNCDP